jgi:hypothetical protein
MTVIGQRRIKFVAVCVVVATVAVAICIVLW